MKGKKEPKQENNNLIGLYFSFVAIKISMPVIQLLNSFGGKRLCKDLKILWVRKTN